MKRVRFLAAKKAALAVALATGVITTTTAPVQAGIPVIDGQHRQIVNYINHLHDAREKHDRTAVGDVINDLIDYTLSHFSFEEELMVESGYPFSGPHKRVHDVLVKRVAEYQLR